MPKVECKLIRDGGTHVKMSDGTEYHFKPETPNGAHVAEVEDRHVSRLVHEIPEGYLLADASVTEPKQTKPAKPSGKTK